MAIKFSKWNDGPAWLYRRRLMDAQRAHLRDAKRGDG